MFVELDEEVNDMGIKDVLSFSWRALKEARYIYGHAYLESSAYCFSSLMHVMASNIEYGPPGVEGGLNYEDFQTLGRLSFSQLAELRHRGAFSTVSQTFAAYCIRCVGSRNSTISDLPKFWYKVRIQSQYGEDVLNQSRKLFCVFRRRQQRLRDDQLDFLR